MIAAAVELGDDCQIGANVTLSHCLIGARVVLHPGVRIGQAGFGFAPDRERPGQDPATRARHYRRRCRYRRQYDDRPRLRP